MSINLSCSLIGFCQVSRFSRKVISYKQPSALLMALLQSLPLLTDVHVSSSAPNGALLLRLRRLREGHKGLLVGDVGVGHHRSDRRAAVWAG